MNTVTLLIRATLVFVDSSGRKIQVGASANPQEAPAWVTETETYKAAFKSGLVYAINYVAAPPTPVKDNKLPANVAGALGFAGPNSPTMDSMLKAGVPIEQAQAALNDMASKTVEVVAPEKKSNLTIHV